MKPLIYKKPLTILVFLIVIFAIAATTMGIFSNDGRGQFEYTSIRGKTVTIYGKGLYKDMSAEVAPQGISQDYVTLFIAIPLLIISFFKAREGSLKGRYLLTGTLGYFLVTYLFYTVMGMYNVMFLPYVILMGASFYSFILIILSFDTNALPNLFYPSTPVKIVIGLLWLSIVVPPLLNGTIIPLQVEHYTTLIVQGLDLGILLPASFISGILLMRKKTFGYLIAPVFFVFLSLLMTALTAKIIAMKTTGYNVIPAIFIIPAFNIIAIICGGVLLKNIKKSS